MLVGVDTGFFYCLKNGDLLAKKVWSEHEIVVSVITKKLGEKALGFNRREHIKRNR